MKVLMIILAILTGAQSYASKTDYLSDEKINELFVSSGVSSMVNGIGESISAHWGSMAGSFQELTNKQVLALEKDILESFNSKKLQKELSLYVNKNFSNTEIKELLDIYDLKLMKFVVNKSDTAKGKKYETYLESFDKKSLAKGRLELIEKVESNAKSTQMVSSISAGIIAGILSGAQVAQSNEAVDLSTIKNIEKSIYQELIVSMKPTMIATWAYILKDLSIKEVQEFYRLSSKKNVDHYNQKIMKKFVSEMSSCSLKLGKTIVSRNSLKKQK